MTILERMSADLGLSENYILSKINRSFTKTSHTSNGNCSLKIQQYRQSDNKLSPCSRSG